MEEYENKQQREDIFSEVVRAGKRTYFFDVKETRAGEKYLTITESKRRFNNDNGKFFYEKHKIFLYREDFEKFMDGFDSVLDFIVKANEHDGIAESSYKKDDADSKASETEITEIKFEDLGKDEEASDDLNTDKNTDAGEEKDKDQDNEKI